VQGLDANAAGWTRAALNSGAGAVTQGNTIYVQPGRFNEFANFRSAAAFEEIVHTAQFAMSGGAGFYSNYWMLTVGGALSGEGGYYGNIDEAFAQGASRQMFDESHTFMCR